jgi:hypothetical protein
MLEPVEKELSPNGKNLYIFFGGIGAGIAIPPFEFYKASRILGDHRLFIRDFSQCWYQTGLPSISNNVYSTATYLQNEITSIGPERVYFVGNSMGGYAAILFSSLIGAGEVIAFAPQTFISPLLRLRHQDRRWRKQILNTYMKSFWKPRVWDLRPLLTSSGHEKKISVLVSKAHRLDHIHACHIADVPGVKLHEFNSGGHAVVKLLRDQGKLHAIMSGTYE